MLIMDTTAHAHTARPSSATVTGGGQPIDGGVLLEEVTHRINNDLTSTIAFIELSAAHSVDEHVRLALAGVAQHVYDVARLQHALRMPGDDRPVDAAASLRELCRAISSSKLRYRNIELVLSETPLTLGARHWWRLAMIVSELVTNSARHAFDGAGGKILIGLSGGQGTVRCSVADNGSASSAFRPGQGSKIVSALVRELDGHIDRVFGAKGSIVTLSFPSEERIVSDPVVKDRLFDDLSCSARQVASAGRRPIGAEMPARS